MDPINRYEALRLAREDVERHGDFLDRHHGDICIYCGEIADTRDHLIPRTWAGDALRSAGPTVPACIDCNVRIRDRHAFTIAERSRIVADRIRQSQHRILRTANHEEEWFEQFGDRLAGQLRRRQYQRKILQRRLEVLDRGGAPFHPDFY